MRSLWFRLTAACVLVAVVAVGVMAALLAQGTEVEFGRYIQRGGSQRAQMLAPSLAEFYAQHQGWQGVDAYVSTLLPAQGNGGQAGGRGMMGRGGMMATDAVLVADAQGRVVAGSAGVPLGKQLEQDRLADGVAVTVGGQRVGTVVVSAGAAGIEPTGGTSEGDFLAAIGRYLVAAGLLAGAVAIVLSLLLSRRITEPLYSMTAAAAAMAAGDLDQRVRVQSDDEVGRLASAFNGMADSLARSQESRRNMVADIAHELRTPLTVLQGNLEALRDGVMEPTPESLASLHEETVLLSRLVSDLRDLSMAEAGQLALRRGPLDVGDLARKSVETLKPQAAQRGVGLDLEAAGGLPPVNGDADRLAQVLRNLVENALRYTPEGGRVSVRVEAGAAPPGKVRITVADTGPGIKPEELPLIFERFYRADPSRARVSGGAGLGLAIVKQLVEAHGGQVWAESTVGAGARFVVVIPASGGAEA